MVRTSDDARDLLVQFAEENGITVSALLEAFARCLQRDRANVYVADCVEEARSIDVERRRRA